VRVDQALAMFIPVPEAGCWLWDGSWNGNKRGQLHIDGEGMIMAPRFFYQHHVGPIADGLFVCHKCDTPACVNPDHLYLGTHTDNMRDRRRKGRGWNPPGEGNPNSRLTEQVVRAIFNDQRRTKYITAHYGVAQATVYDIKRGRRWKHLGLLRARAALEQEEGRG
jgi:hypothetical protein